jgi:hypothetical protein
VEPGYSQAQVVTMSRSGASSATHVQPFGAPEPGVGVNILCKLIAYSPVSKIAGIHACSNWY